MLRPTYTTCAYVRPTTASRLATTFHSKPIGNNFSQQADWQQLFTACRLATSHVLSPVPAAVGLDSDVLSTFAPGTTVDQETNLQPSTHVWIYF